MKILLINAFYVGMYGNLKSAAGRYFPLGLGYIASVLLSKGHEVKIIDPEVENLNIQKLEYLLVRENPQIVGISCATPSFNYAIQIATIVKKKTKALTVLGGTHASALPEYVISNHPYIDIVCIGEGEITMCEIADALKNGRAWETVQGLAFRRGNEIIFSKPRPYITNVDTIPFPARHLVNLRKYYPNAHYYHSRSATMITSRGCPFGCIFCASFTTLGKKFRPHSANYVIREIEHLYEKYGVRYIIFNDDTFTYDKARTVEICKMIISKKLDIRWYCFARVDTIDYELASLMKNAGCTTIGFGVESSSQKILNNLRKGITVEQAQHAFEVVNKLKMKTLAFFIFGSPEETKETMMDTIKYSKILKPTLAFYNYLIPYPGTPIFKNHNMTSQISKKSYNWNDFVAVGLNPTNKDNQIDYADIKKALYYAYKSFYMRPSQIIKIISKLNSIFELWINFMAAIGLIIQNIKWKKNIT